VARTTKNGMHYTALLMFCAHCRLYIRVGLLVRTSECTIMGMRFKPTPIGLSP